MPTRTGTYGVTDDICEERRCNLHTAIALAVAHERELRERETLMRDKALIAQAQEYSRRLEDLNHLRRGALDDRSAFYTKEAHESFATEYRRFRDETRQHQQTVTTWGAAAIFMLGLLQAFLHFFVR